MSVPSEEKIRDADSVSDDEFSESEDDVPIKFKHNVLNNKKLFEKQLLESTEINPEEIFEVKPVQEVEGEVRDLYNKMDQQILECFDVDEDEDNKIMKLSLKMTPVPGIDGLFKKLCQPGEGICPPEDSIVTIHYNGYVQDDISNQIKSFDSTFLRGKAKSFMRGQGEVIEGLDCAVGTMKLNEQSEFIFSPDLAFGERGCPPRIPANAYVYFKIDLIDWIDSSAAEAYGKLPMSVRKSVSFEQVLEAAKSEKRKGTAFCEKSNFISAGKCYRKALHWIEDHGYANEEEEKLGMSLCLKLHLNLAMTNLKTNHPKKTCNHCKDALAIDPQSAKAYYRFGLAKEKLGDFSAARQLLSKAKQICPLDSSIARALMNLDEKIRREKYVETELCRKMLGSASIAENDGAVTNSEAYQFIKDVLLEFVDNPNEKHLDFPQGMSQQERLFLESEAKKLNLKFCLKPVLKGQGICSVFKSE